MQICIDGLNVYYEEAGSGEKAVLVLHGWGANVDVMRSITAHVAAKGAHAYALDFPGFGKSHAPAAAWGVPEYAELTRKFIDALGLRGCDVICHSFGGRVAIMLASGDEGLFSKLVFVDAAGVRPKRSAGYYVRTYSYKLAKRLAKIGFIDKLFRISEKQKSAGSEDYRALSGTMRQTFVKVVNLDLTPLLDGIRNETLLIWGELDEDTPLYMAKIMEKRIKNSGLAVIAGAKHFSFLDKPGQFMAILDAMLFQ